MRTPRSRGYFADACRSKVRTVFEDVLDPLSSAQVVESMNARNHVVRKINFASALVVDCAVALVVVTGNESRIRLIRLLRQMHKLIYSSDEHDCDLLKQFIVLLVTRHF